MGWNWFVKTILLDEHHLVYNGRWPMVEDDYWWKKILMEDTLWWKTTCYGRQPLMEDNLWWKTTFDGRWPLMEDDPWWKQPLMEDNLRWVTSFDGTQTLFWRQPLLEDNSLGIWSQKQWWVGHFQVPFHFVGVKNGYSLGFVFNSFQWAYKTSQEISAF